MDLSKVPTWLIAIGVSFFSIGFLISLFALDEPRSFAGLEFGPKSRAISGELIVDFTQQKEKAVGEISQAKGAGIVTARLSSSNSGAVQGIICGYVGESNDPKLLRTAASMEYRNKVYIPESSFTMPVRSGEFWVVKGCSGNVEGTEVYWHGLEVKQP